MIVTYIAPYVPHERIPTAGGLFFFHYLRAIAEHHEVHLIAPGDSKNVAAEAISPPGVHVELFDVGNRARTRLGRVLNGLPYLPGGLTPGAHILKAFRRNGQIQAQLNRSDLVEIQWGHYLPVIPIVRHLTAARVPITMLAHDVMTQSVGSRAKVAGTAAGRLKARLDLPRIRRREVSCMNQCDAIMVFAEKDLRLVKQLGVTQPVYVLDPFLLEAADQYQDITRSPSEVLFVGALHRPENWEGALWFIEKTWPRILAQEPDAHLYIVGANPPDLLARQAGSSITVTGWVDDLEPYYRSAGVFVAPNFTGGGLKFKVPQAMLYGLPVVCTPIAAEGIAEEADLNVLAAVTEDPTTMAQAIVHLMQAPESAAAQGSIAKKWARERYSFQKTLETVLSLYAQLHHESSSSAAET